MVRARLLRVLGLKDTVTLRGRSWTPRGHPMGGCSGRQPANCLCDDNSFIIPAGLYHKNGWGWSASSGTSGSSDTKCHKNGLSRRETEPTREKPRKETSSRCFVRPRLEQVLAGDCGIRGIRGLVWCLLRCFAANNRWSIVLSFITGFKPCSLFGPPPDSGSVLVGVTFVPCPRCGSPVVFFVSRPQSARGLGALHDLAEVPGHRSSRQRLGVRLPSTAFVIPRKNPDAGILDRINRMDRISGVFADRVCNPSLFAEPPKSARGLGALHDLAEDAIASVVAQRLVTTSPRAVEVGAPLAVFPNARWWGEAG